MSDIIVIVIVILGLAVVLLYLQKNQYQRNNQQIKENLTDYKTLPFGEILEEVNPHEYDRHYHYGNDRYDRYRKPYRSPVCIQTDHHIRHCAPLD